jgi:serine/threonine protein kinase
MNDLELELQVLRQLSHANIVGMLGAGMHPRKGRFLLLERLTGGTLTDVLKREHIRLEVQQPPQLRKTGGMSLRARLGQERSTKRTLLDALTLPNSRSRLSGSRKSGSGEGEREGRIEPPTVAWLAQVVRSVRTHLHHGLASSSLTLHVTDKAAYFPIPIRWGLQIADAMHYMHHEAKHGYLLLHRDLKPDSESTGAICASPGMAGALTLQNAPPRRRSC